MTRISSWLCMGAVAASVLAGAASADKVPAPKVTISVKSAAGCAQSAVESALDAVENEVHLCAGLESGAALYACSFDGKGKATKCPVAGGDHKDWDKDTVKCMSDALQKLQLKPAASCKATISVDVQATRYRRPSRGRDDSFPF